MIINDRIRYCKTTKKPESANDIAVYTSYKEYKPNKLVAITNKPILASDIVVYTKR